jgi:hypothetical protein
MKALVFLVALALAAPAAAVPVNVALGKPVTLLGTFGNSTAGTPIGWADPAPGPASLVTDGVFQPAHTNWQTDSIWWHQYDTLPPRQIVIDLQGVFTLTGAIVQADNNDIYPLEYQDIADVWHVLWTVPAFATDGVVTRPNPADDLEIFNFAPVDAKALRISGTGGDLYYSVTEVQAFAQAAPEPTTLALLGIGLLGSACWRRRTSK